jgi:UDP-3-O-[3-hydroxymyristoyl] glucosamine N-acyltransferase
MKFTVDQIADLIEGTVNGNGATLISNFDKIEEGKSGSISFLSNPKSNRCVSGHRFKRSNAKKTCQNRFNTCF